MNTASVPTFRYWGISFFWLFLGIAGAAKKQYFCTVFVKLVYCMKKVHLSSPVASRRSAIILYCMVVGLGFVSASAQAVDGVSGASTRVLAPADSLRIDSTNTEMPYPSRPIESPTTIDSTSMQTAKKQARKHLVTVQAEVPEPSPKKGRLTIGGYGEATMKRCFYSNNYLRYT